MACSFHHTGKFSRSLSSIRVNKDISLPEKGSQVEIVFMEEEGRASICDQCTGEDLPFCVRYCPEAVFKLERRRT
jgi:Fe-S-cluster-containing hydrogenase component 2